MGEMRNAYRSLAKEPEVKKPLGRFGGSFEVGT
jgi:hypothetical protein